jgi:5-methylcytosine-specific restriction protein A
MKFSNFHKLYFDAIDGAFSKVTHTEATDPQITVDKYEKQIVWQKISDSSIYRGSTESGGALAHKKFKIWPTGKVLSIPLVYPYPSDPKKRNQLRLYPTKRTGFTVEPNDFWFIFTRPDDKNLWLGSKTGISWVQLGREDLEDSAFVRAVEESSGNRSRASLTLTSRFSRNPSLAAKCLRRADYKCEASAAHEIFESRASRKGYVEPHHLVPVSLQEKGRFRSLKLDSAENIYALCADCHARVHHAHCSEIAKILDALLAVRPGVLATFAMTRAEILDCYDC